MRSGITRIDLLVLLAILALLGGRRGWGLRRLGAELDIRVGDVAAREQDVGAGAGSDEQHGGEPEPDDDPPPGPGTIRRRHGLRW